jgi:hypothetical protein
VVDFSSELTGDFTLSSKPNLLQAVTAKRKKQTSKEIFMITEYFIFNPPIIL